MKVGIPPALMKILLDFGLFPYLMKIWLIFK